MNRRGLLLFRLCFGELFGGSEGVEKAGTSLGIYMHRGMCEMAPCGSIQSIRFVPSSSQVEAWVGKSHTTYTDP